MSLIEGYRPNITSNSYVLAFYPEESGWIATHNRHSYFEYPVEFPTEVAAFTYFKENADIFWAMERHFNLSDDLDPNRTYYRHFGENWWSYGVRIDYEDKCKYI